MKEELIRWLNQAREEFDTAKINFKAKKYFSAAFWSQQAAEKALKALLIKNTQSFPKIHDLVQLARLNKAPLEIVELCAKLNPAYTASRYPDTPKEYTKEECEKILLYCQEVLKWTKKNLD